MTLRPRLNRRPLRDDLGSNIEREKRCPRPLCREQYSRAGKPSHMRSIACIALKDPCITNKGLLAERSQGIALWLLGKFHFLFRRSGVRRMGSPKRAAGCHFDLRYSCTIQIPVRQLTQPKCTLYTKRVRFVSQALGREE